MLIIAHRGASHDAPENTLAAVRLAWEQGADAVEVDVHLTRDGRLAVIHDSDTERVGRVRRSVAATALAELRTLDVGRWKAPSFAGEKIPELPDVLGLVPAGKRIFIELKGGPEAVTELKRCLDQPGQGSGAPLQRDQITVIAFDLTTAHAAKQALPRHEVCWLAEAGGEARCATLAEVAATAMREGLDGVDVEAGWPVDKLFTQQCHDRAFKVYVWTVDDPRRARELTAAGVDGITTNRPGWLRAQLASM